MTPRRTPLKASKSLTRRTPLKAVAGLARTSPLAAVSPRRKAALKAAGKPVLAALATRYTGPTRRVCALVDGRAEGRCEFPDCCSAGDDRHHRLNRKNGGRHGEMRRLVNSAAWLLIACRPHHNLVTDADGEELAEAKRSGWVLNEGQDAARVPVATGHSERLVWLDNEGNWSTEPPGEVAA